MKEDILGYSVDTCSAAAWAAEAVDGWEINRAPKWLACLNPHSYAVAREDKQFAAALKDADWLIPDGAGVVLASRALGGSIHQRVTGSDVFLELMKRLEYVGGKKVFFLGGTERTLGLISARLARDYPGVELAGTYSPPFKARYSSEELDAMIEAVNAARADVLWVGLTAPKQEKWIYENRSRLEVRVVAAVGAVFDFYAGTVKRSAPLFQKLGLEWLPRLLQQPKRLWRRMFVSAPVFLFHVARARFAKQA